MDKGSTTYIANWPLVHDGRMNSNIHYRKLFLVIEI